MTEEQVKRAAELLNDRRILREALNKGPVRELKTEVQTDYGPYGSSDCNAAMTEARKQAKKAAQIRLSQLIDIQLLRIGSELESLGVK